MRPRSTEQQKSRHSQTHLICDRCCVLVNSFYITPCVKCGFTHASRAEIRIFTPRDIKFRIILVRKTFTCQVWLHHSPSAHAANSHSSENVSSHSYRNVLFFKSHCDNLSRVTTSPGLPYVWFLNKISIFQREINISIQQWIKIIIPINHYSIINPIIQLYEVTLIVPRKFCLQK